jgi:hypothetical protein
MPGLEERDALVQAPAGRASRGVSSMSPKSALKMSTTIATRKESAGGYAMPSARPSVSMR